MAPYNDDGDFGSLTHNATVGWQRERGITATGVVDLESWAAMGSDPIDRPEPDAEIKLVLDPPPERPDPTRSGSAGGAALEGLQLVAVAFAPADIQERWGRAHDLSPLIITAVPGRRAP